MIEFWQAVVLTLTGGSLGVIATLLAQRSTAAANRDAEERQAKRRIEEEQRQARRQFRRKRMQSILDSLAVAKRYLAAQRVRRMTDQAYEKLPPKLKEQVTAAQWREAAQNELAEPDPDIMNVNRAITVALATAPMLQLQEALASILISLAEVKDAKTHAKAQGTIRTAEEMIERYLVEV